jgi:hypothetical protein
MDVVTLFIKRDESLFRGDPQKLVKCGDAREATSKALASKPTKPAVSSKYLSSMCATNTP